MNPLPTALDHYEVWFLTGSQDLYGEDTLRQVAEQSREIVRVLGEAGLPVEVVWKPTLKDADSIRRTALELNAADGVIGAIAWMHTFSPAKMWITGLDALRKPLLHLHTQINVELPWGEIDFDFMNLNQAAHGDREFGYIQTRLDVPRKTVVGHVSTPGVTAQIASWQRACAGRAAVQGLRVARFGDNMRNVAVTEGDKTEAELQFGVSVNTWGVNDLVAVVDAQSEDRVDELVAEYEELYDVAPELRRGGERHESLRYGARQELGMLQFLEEGGFGAFTTNFEDLGRLRQLPGLAVQRLMARGYGFGAEGDWKTALLVRAAKVMGAGLPGGASLMEDYTYHLVPGEEKIPAPTCWRSARASPRRAPPSRCTRWASADARTPCAWSSTPTPAPAWSWRCPTCGTASGSPPTPWTSCPRTPRSRTCRWPGPSGGRTPTSRPRPRPGSPPAPPTTRSSAPRWAPT